MILSYAAVFYLSVFFILFFILSTVFRCISTFLGILLMAFTELDMGEIPIKIILSYATLWLGVFLSDIADSESEFFGNILIVVIMALAVYACVMIWVNLETEVGVVLVILALFSMVVELSRKLGELFEKAYIKLLQCALKHLGKC